MAENEVVIEASREQVFAFLADGPRYDEWVIAADDDSTEVIASEPPTRLELLAHLGPLGSLRVEFKLDALAGNRTCVRMEEAPVEGVSKPSAPVGDALGRIRSMLSLSRLKTIAER